MVQPQPPPPGVIAALPVAEMEARLVATAGVAEGDLQALASAMREYLVTAMP